MCLLIVRDVPEMCFHVLRLYEISKSDPVQKYNLREIKHFECARCYMQAIALDGKIRKHEAVHRSQLILLQVVTWSQLSCNKS